MRMRTLFSDQVMMMMMMMTMRMMMHDDDDDYDDEEEVYYAVSPLLPSPAWSSPSSWGTDGDEEAEEQRSLPPPIEKEEEEEDEDDRWEKGTADALLSEVLEEMCNGVADAAWDEVRQEIDHEASMMEEGEDEIVFPAKKRRAGPVQVSEEEDEDEDESAYYASGELDEEEFVAACRARGWRMAEEVPEGEDDGARGPLPTVGPLTSGSLGDALRSSLTPEEWLRREEEREAAGLRSDLNGNVEGEVEEMNLMETDNLPDMPQPAEETDPFAGIVLPEIDSMNLKRVKMGQKGKLSNLVKEWVGGNVPGKAEALKLDTEEVSVLKNISLFKLNLQEVIFRLFVHENGLTEILIFVEGDALKDKVNEIHERMGHCSKKTVFEVLSKEFYSTNLRNKIKKILNGCPACLSYNIHKGIKEKQSTLFECQSRQTLECDLLGPLPNSHGNKYIFAGIDSYDRTIHLRAIKSTSAECMGEVFSRIFAECGVWRYIKIDSKCISFKGVDKQLMKKLGVRVNRSNHTSRHQGMIERALQTVLIKILKLLEKEDNLSGWAPVLRRVEFLMNSMPREILGGRSSYEVTHFRPPSLFVPILRGELDLKGGNFEKIVKISNEVRWGAYRTYIRNRFYGHVGEGLSDKEIVWRKRQNFSTNMNRKLQNKISEVFQVIKKLGSNLYEVQNLRTLGHKVVPGDQLIRSNMSREEALEVLDRIENPISNDEG